MELEKWHQAALDYTPDGWVPAERWCEVLKLHETVYNNWIEAARTEGDPGLTEERARKMWPYDTPEVLKHVRPPVSR
jgi:hypothetical protein